MGRGGATCAVCCCADAAAAAAAGAAAAAAVPYACFRLSPASALCTALHAMLMRGAVHHASQFSLLDSRTSLMVACGRVMPVCHACATLAR